MIKTCIYTCDEVKPEMTFHYNDGQYTNNLRVTKVTDKTVTVRVLRGGNDLKPGTFQKFEKNDIKYEIWSGWWHRVCI